MMNKHYPSDMRQVDQQHNPYFGTSDYYQTAVVAVVIACDNGKLSLIKCANIAVNITSHKALV